MKYLKLFEGFLLLKEEELDSFGNKKKKAEDEEDPGTVLSNTTGTITTMEVSENDSHDDEALNGWFGSLPISQKHDALTTDAPIEYKELINAPSYQRRREIESMMIDTWNGLENNLKNKKYSEYVSKFPAWKKLDKEQIK